MPRRRNQNQDWASPAVWALPGLFWAIGRTKGLALGFIKNSGDAAQPRLTSDGEAVVNGLFTSLAGLQAKA